MVLKSCGYCKEMVDLSAGPHVHDPKGCQRCGEVLPAADFQPWHSSADGRRHTCRNCVSGESENARAQLAVQRDKQFRSDNEKLKEYGYRWKRRPAKSGPNEDFGLVLLDPRRQEVTKEQAVRSIMELEAPKPEDEDFAYF